VILLRVHARPHKIKRAGNREFPPDCLLVEDLTAIGYPRPAPLFTASDPVLREYNRPASEAFHRLIKSLHFSMLLRDVTAPRESGRLNQQKQSFHEH
jgi:hypothetical protein